MDVALLLKVVGIGFVVLVAHQILSKAGRDEQAMLVSVAGVITVFLLLIQEFSTLLSTIRGLFGL